MPYDLATAGPEPELVHAVRDDEAFAEWAADLAGYDEEQLLGQVPMDTALRECREEGVPLVLSALDSPASKVLRTIADQLAGQPRGLAGTALSLPPTSRNA